MGIKKDLKLVGNEFSNTATWFFIAYLIAEVPNGSCHPIPSLSKGYMCLHLRQLPETDPAYSLLSPESPCSQVARRKCFPLGRRCGRLCWRQ